MPSLRLGIWATVTYTAIIAVATVLLFQVWDGPTDIRGVLLALLPVQLIAVLFCLIVVFRFVGWQATGFGRLHRRGLAWFLPAWLVLAAMGWGIASDLTAEDLNGFDRLGLVVLVVTPFLIAFGEEVMFRGLLLRGALKRFQAPTAMMLSAALFGLFHLVNGLAGQDAVETSQQILFAVIVGFFLAPIALRVGNLWPLIIWHWLWNIAIILGQVAGLLHPLALFGIAIQAVVSLWLWADIIRQSRRI